MTLDDVVPHPQYRMCHSRVVDEQLGIRGGRRPAEQHQPAAEPDEDEIDQAKVHGRS